MSYSSKNALRITAIYFFISVVWIFGSDTFVLNTFKDKSTIELVSIIKGWVFVICTSILIYILVRHAIDAIQQQRKNLALNEAKLENLFDWASDGIFIFDDGGNYVDVNPRGCQMLGYSREEIAKQNITDTVLLENESLPIQFERLRRGETVITERKLIKKDRSIIQTEISARALPNGNIQAIVRDITERKIIEDKLKQQEEILLETGSMAMVGGWEFDVATLKGTWTPEVAKIHDLDPNNETNVEIGLSFYKDEDRKKIETAIENAIRNKIPYDIELELVSAKGIHKWVRTIGKPICEAGKVIKLRGAFQDITKYKLLEQDILRSREQYRALSSHLQTVREEERTHIAREMHDELGQILTSLKMNMSLMRREVESKAGLIEPQEIVNEINSMNTLIDNAVRSVRKLITELRPELLDKLGLIAALEWFIQEFAKRTKIECEFLTEVEHLKLNPEKELAVFRIVQESLTNAAKYSGADKINVSIKKTDENIFVEINDNGKGISEVELKGTKSYGLLGMRERANIIGAELYITGQPQKGTTIKLRINI